jgi:K+-transporting ATPase ATPase A chain
LSFNPNQARTRDQGDANDHGDGLFIGLLIGVILIMGGLIYFPALALGPIEEHLAMRAGSLF